MGRFQGVEDAQQHSPGLGPVELPGSLDPLAQRLPRDPLHRQERRVAVGVDVDDLDDTGVVDPVLEGAGPQQLADVIVRRYLDRDDLVRQRAVVCLEDYAERAAANLVVEVVSADAGTWRHQRSAWSISA